jgi:iron uptake system component EfeO
VRSRPAPSTTALSGSGSGLAPDDTAEATSSNPLVQTAVDEYEAYVRDQVRELRTRATVLTDAVRADDLAAAHAAYAPSRVPWETIEPIAGLVGATDAVVDSRVDDFAGPSDPDFTGWHRLEYLLWEKDTTAGGAAFATRLDRDLGVLQAGVNGLQIPPTAMAKGAAELIEEVSAGKITGEEDRYSKTDLWDFAANVEGSRTVVELLTPALAEADPDLLARLQDGFAALDASLAPLRRGLRAVLPARRRVPVAGALPPSNRDRRPDRPHEGPAGRAVGGPGPGAGRPRPLVGR